MTNGTLRFITGDANKRAYTIWTPTAAIGVRGTNLLRLKTVAIPRLVVNEEGTAIVCARKRNEYVTVNELRKRCKGREEEQANITDSRKRSCPCTALLLPNQLATVTQDEILVAEAPLNAIADPFPESFGFGGFAPFVGAGLVGRGGWSLASQPLSRRRIAPQAPPSSRSLALRGFKRWFPNALAASGADGAKS